MSKPELIVDGKNRLGESAMWHPREQKLYRVDVRAPAIYRLEADNQREFAKAYDGPPTDPKVFEENQKKLQEELQKRAEEQRKKLEGAGVGANPAAK